MDIVRYNADLKSVWEDCIAHSKNGTFLFYRDFMEYHEDRFEDYSLMFFDKNTCVAVLPANVENQHFFSHKGLTYGGLIMSKPLKTQATLDIFERLLNFLKTNGFKTFTYKVIPYIYHRYPAQEDLYALFRMNARLSTRQVSSVIDNSVLPKIKPSQLRQRGIHKAKRNHLEFQETTDYKDFWQILETNLIQRYQQKPVHTLKEISKLQARFPQHIKLYTVRNTDQNTLAGTVVFEDDNWVHTQYIAADEEGKKTGALDLLMDLLINDIYKDKPYFDFGHSCEEDGRFLNQGLIAQKEGFGARAVVYDTYQMDL